MAFPGTNCLWEVVRFVGQVAGEVPRPRVQAVPGCPLSLGNSAALGRAAGGAALGCQDTCLCPGHLCGPRPPPRGLASQAQEATGLWCHTLISSCFLFCFQKTPGPGAYAASAQFPRQPRTIAKMGREHSLFFNNTIGF